MAKFPWETGAKSSAKPQPESKSAADAPVLPAVTPEPVSEPKPLTEDEVEVRNVCEECLNSVAPHGKSRVVVVNSAALAVPARAFIGGRASVSVDPRQAKKAIWRFYNN